MSDNISNKGMQIVAFRTFLCTFVIALLILPGTFGCGEPEPQETAENDAGGYMVEGIPDIDRALNGAEDVLMIALGYPDVSIDVRRLVEQRDRSYLVRFELEGEEYRTIVTLDENDPKGYVWVQGKASIMMTEDLTDEAYQTWLEDNGWTPSETGEESEQ